MNYDEDNNDLDLTDSGIFVSTSFEELIATQQIETNNNSNSINIYSINSDSNNSFGNDIILTNPESPINQDLYSFNNTTQTSEDLYNKLNNSNKNIYNENDNYNGNDNSSNKNIKTTTTTTTTSTISTTTAKPITNNRNSFFNKKIVFDKVRLYIKDNVIYKCRFLLSKASKKIDLVSEETQKRVQKLVYILLLKKGEVIFLRDKDILVSLRLHLNNSMKNKTIINNQSGRSIEVDRNKYTFIIQRL